MRSTTRPASSSVKRYAATLDALPKLGLFPGPALREVFRKGYGRRDLGHDVLAGLVVSVVALPLSMALAISSGVAPQYGLYTAIVAGFLVPLFGGARTQVTGPTAAFVVILAPISSRYGLGGLLLASVMAGAILVVFGVARLGRFIEFIPHPVTTGFTAGIATVIATLQLKDFLGLNVPGAPEHFLERVVATARALPTIQMGDLLVGTFTLVLLLSWPRVSARIPPALIALPAAAVLAVLLSHVGAGYHAATIASRFSYLVDGHTMAGIPPFPPRFLWPWKASGAGGEPLVLSFALLRTLVPNAFAIAILGAIESLLCAVVADGMSGTRHDPDAELLALGVGNLVAPFFGGFAATGALARTTFNIRSGAHSPLAAAFHAVFLLVAVVAFASVLGMLPLASMAALLLTVAWRMSEIKHFTHTLVAAPKSDVSVLLACYLCTVLFDMVVGVSVGIMLAALLLMKRMAETVSARPLTETSHHADHTVPRGVVLYEVAGPLFFGAAQKAINVLESLHEATRAVVFDITAVPVIDFTALVALESAIQKLHRRNVLVVLAGVQPQPARVFAKAGLKAIAGKLVLSRTLAEGVARTREQLGAVTPLEVPKSS
jgi:SulP family sulfate permease